ncbi:MAG: Stk1 family PASTA domain-containing Ser/Thr kinase [Pseudonocardia sp.]|nr:Stk1 family PASTA domain-containing Ser/Thr kinase [Pseudonocardia sp.]
MDERPGAELTAVAARSAGVLLDGRYRLGPALARGGMSTVYRATDIRLDRPVAVKVMDPRLAADPAFLARFEREARSAARIDHPTVVDVHDQGTGVLGDGEPVVFLVMELVDGGTLRDVLRERGALPVPTAVAVLGPVLDGLAQAHARGLVHRDVKPENVLISRTGEVKVADFGLVTPAAQAGASHAGMILGTVAYLSPEQVATGAADARSDVYATGVLAYELLTGAPPYTGDTAISIAYRHVHDDVPAPSARAAGVPPELDDLIVRATRRDPALRPVDAAAFLTALCRVVDRARITPAPPPVPPARPEPVDAGHATTAAVPQRLPGLPGPRGTRALPREEAARAAGGAPAPATDPARLRRRSRTVFGAWVSVVAVLGLLVGAAGWWLADGRWTSMPTVVGAERAAAERLLLAADLVATVSVARDDEVTAGLVSAVDPAPGARLLRGSAVRLTVSSGRPQVPAVAVGTPVAVAEQAVRDAGLAPTRSGSAREYSATAPAGSVVRTDPAAGTALPSGGRVTLVISRGAEPPRQVRVPLLIGRTAAEATAALAAVGLQAEVDNGFLFGGRPADQAQVVGQSHGPGSMVDRGTTITLRAF